MTARSILSQIDNIARTDPQKGTELFSQFRTFQFDPTSPIYNPYESYTNRAIDYLSELGVDMSGGVNDDWFQKNSWLTQYYVPTANTNSLSTTMTNKRASTEQKAAYYYHQLEMAEAQTKKAEQEWSALQEELSYWANRRDRNLSDDQIIANIDWSKYKTLKSMDEAKTPGTSSHGTPMELNRAIGYSEDAMYATLWAARNNGGTGNVYQDMINSYNGVGNVWQQNQDTAARLDANNYKTNYNPNWVSSTMDDECLYFGVDSFDQSWLDQNYARIMSGNDETAKKYAMNVYDGVQRTNETKEQKAKLDEWLDRKLANLEPNTDPESIIKLLDNKLASSDYNRLADIDKGIQKISPAKLTEKVEYGHYDYVQRIMAACEEANSRKSTVEEAEDFLADSVADPVDETEETAPAEEKPSGISFGTALGVAWNALTGTAQAAWNGLFGGSSAPVQNDASSAQVPAATEVSPDPFADGYGRGNIDLNNRPVVQNADGSFSTEQSFSFYDEDSGKEVLVPSVVDGRIVSEKEAIDHYYETGENLGMFDTPEEADEYAEALHERQEAYYGSQAPAKQTEPTPKLTEQEKEIIKEQDKVLDDTLDAIEEIATETEAAVFNTTGKASSAYVKTLIDDYKNRDLRLTSKLTQGIIKDSNARNASYVLEGITVINGYELNRANIDSIHNKQAEIEETLGDKIRAGQEMSDTGTISVEVDGTTYQCSLYYDEGIGSYAVQNTYAYNPNGSVSRYLGDVDQEKLESEIQRKINGLNETRASQERVNSTPLTEEEQAMIEEYNSLADQMDQAIQYDQANQEAYDEAIRNRNVLEASRRYIHKMFEDAGVPQEMMQDFANVDAVVQSLQAFIQYDPTEWESFNTYDAYAAAMNEGFDAGTYAEVLEAAKHGDEENAKQKELAEWELNYADRMGLQIPDSIRSIIERYIAKLDRDHLDYEYFSLIGNEDFHEGAEVGRQIAANPKAYLDPNSSEYALAAQYFGDYVDRGMSLELGQMALGMYKLDKLMTSYEQETYYYLLGTSGVESAVEYYRHLTDSSYGVLQTRSTEEFQNAASDLAESGFWGRRAADVMSMIYNPVAALGSVGYAIEYGVQKLAGENVEYNPNNVWLSFNNFRSTARETVQEEIKNKYGEGTVLEKLFSSVQEMVSNRGDSMMNALTFGWLTGGIENEMLQEFIGALPMAAGAMADSMSEVKRRGGSDEQAWKIGTVTLFAESVTEAISLDNINNALGLGHDVDAATLKTFLQNWLTHGGVSEAIGESLSDIIENLADEIVMADLSEHSNRVQKYLGEGMSEDEAEAAARREELNNLLHTALISYLSPGMDIASYAAGRIDYYRTQTRTAQQAGYNVNIFDVMRADKARRKIGPQIQAAAQDVETGAPSSPAITETQTETETESPAEQTTEQAAEGQTGAEAAEGTNISPEQNTQATPEAVQNMKDFQILEKAKGSNAVTQTESVASVLDLGGTTESSETAHAAAVNGANLFGETSFAEGLQNLIAGANANGTDVNQVKLAVINAALGGEKSAAWRIMQTDGYKNATAAEQAAMLARSVRPDSYDQTMQGEAAKKVREYRITQKEAELARQNGIGTKEKQEALDKANQDVADAKERAESAQGEADAKRDAMTTASNEAINNPTDENTNAADQARREWEHSQKTAESEEAAVPAAEQRQQKAKEDLKETTAEAMAEVRQQAEEAVNAEDQARAEAAAQALAQAEAEQQRMAEEAVRQEEADNALTADVDALIEGYYPNATDEEKTLIREMAQGVARQLQQEGAENPTATVDELLNRNKITKSISQKFGVNIRVLDTTNGGAVSRQNGYYDRRTGTIVLDSNASVSDMMYFVLGHELTHVAEQSGTYTDLANSLLRMRYGSDASYTDILRQVENGQPTSRLAADIIARKSLYDQRLEQMHEQDSSIDATPLSYEEALQEIVADEMGKLLNGDQELVNRLAAEEPSTLRRIIDAIKGFIKKATGMKGAWLTDAQKTVDMLEKALNDAKGKQTDGEKKYMLMEFEDGKRYVDLQTDQSIFDGLTTSQMQDVAKKYIKDHFKNKVIGIDNKAFVNGKSAEEFYYTPGRNVTDDDIRSKMRTAPEIDNLMDAGTPDGHADDGDSGHVHENYPGGFDYYRAIYKIGNKYFDARINVGYTTKGKKFHNVTDIKNVTQDILSSYGPNPKSHFLRNSSMDNVAQENPDVKPLVTDDQGNDIVDEMRGGTVVRGESYSLSSWTEEEQSRVRRELRKSGFSEESIDKWINDTNGLASMIAADRARLDFTADPTKTMLKPNAEYVKTLDASTLCAKRLLYQGTFNEIQHALPNTPLMPEDLIDLSNMMREMGYETPCGICYVESRRRHLGKFASQWLEGYQGEYKPTLDQVTTSDGLEDLRINHPQTYSDFTAAMNKKGTMNPKVVQLRTDYRGEISQMTAGQIQKVKDIGGLRVQSFSDFETPHLLDMIQAVMDMASKKLTAQAYTKVPNMPWAFGDTGIKINLSLIGAGTGLDVNGNLVFDDVEGMPFDEAMRLRDRYSKNVGTILVGMNDDHILAAMADDRIDFIIPFHKSGWSASELEKMPVLNGYDDYTDFQNEKAITGRDNKGNYKTESLEKSKRVNFQPVGENGYWDFNKSGKENAETYLKMCAEDGRLPKFSQFLVDNGDGSFSLQPDGSTDGYWKTLIDFKMYDNDGVGAPQTEVTPNINMAQAQRILNEYSLDRNGISRADNNSLPVAQPVVERYVEEYKAKHPLDENRTRYSLPIVNPVQSKDETYHSSVRYSLPTNDQEEETLRNQYKTARQTEIDLRDRKSQIEKSEEMKSWEDRMVAARGDELKALLAEYKQWETDSGYADIAKNYDAARKTTKDALKALDDYVEQRNVREEQEKILASGLSEPDWRRKEAVKEFGYTTNVNEAGYMLPNGKMLNFTGEKGKHYGYRGQDHRAIGTIYASQEKQHTAAMNAFMNDGNIRLMPESPGIDVSNAIEPTAEQYSGIRSMIRSLASKEFFSVDFSDQDGRNIGNLEYEGRVHPDRVVNDIKAFFRTGEVPQQSGLDRFRYSLPSDAPYMAAVERGEMDRAQEIVNEAAKEAGYTDRAYHGTNTFGFTQFDPAVQGEIFVAYDTDTAGSYTRDKDVRPVSDGASMDYSEYLADNDKMAQLAKERLTNLYGVPVRDVRWQSKENLTAKAKQILQDRVLSALDGVTWESEEVRNGDIQAMAQRTSVGVSTLSKAQTPAELEQMLYNAYIENGLDTTGVKIVNFLAPLLTLRGGMKVSEAKDIMWDLNRMTEYAQHPFGMFEFDVANRNNVPVYFDQRKVVDMIAEANRDKGGIYDLYTRPGNQMVVDAGGVYWNKIQVDWSDEPVSTRDIAEHAKSEGYDSVRINNVRDVGIYRADGMKYGASDIGIFFNFEDVKSADPVTYDDQGNVIPLSERFNDQNNDIRYSLPSDDVLQEQIRNYFTNGGILSNASSRALEGDNPVLSSANPNLPQRQFGSQTAQNSDELNSYVQRFLANNSGYIPDSNTEQMSRAIQWIANNKSNKYSDGLYESVQKVVSGDFDYRSADGQARMVAVMGMAVAKNDVMAQVTLADAYNRQGTDLGRALQARKLFRLMTPEGRVASMQKMLDNCKTELGKKGINRDLKFSDWIYMAASAATSENDFQTVQQAASQELAAQLPASWKEKLTSWRMLSMLGNPRTHIRNVVGNAIFMPAVGIKNKVGALGEIATGQKNRTKTLGLASSEARAFAKQDAKTMEGVLRGDAKYNDGDQVQQARKAFGQGKGIISKTFGKALQGLSDVNSNALEAEDWIFLQRHYRNALAGYMTANKLTAEQMTGKILENAREYAVQEAQKATYRDANAIATWLNKAQREHPAAGFVVNAVLPFKKTPANILKRGVEYSPVGLVNALTRGNHQVKLWTDYQNGKLSVMPEKAISPTQWIDKVSSGLTGTAIMALGAALSSLGVVHAGLDDDDDEFDKLRGEQEYSINLELFGNDVSYTIDWAAPVCMPFFVGASIFDEFSKENPDVSVSKVLDSLLSITEPVFNLSMLDGVNSLLDVSQYAEGNAITQIGEKIVTNYATSYIPTFVGQVARTMDNTRRKSYVESGADLSTFRYAWEQSENKLPWLSKTNIPYRDVWGNAETNGSALENFFSPGYLNEIKDDAVVNELERIYQNTGSSSVIPKAAGKTISVEGETIRMNAEQYDQYVVSRGQKAYQTLESLMESPLWQMCDDATRVDLVNDAWTYANQLARHDVDERGKVDSWIMNAHANGNVVDAIIDRAVERNQKSYISGYGQSLAEAIDNDNMEIAETSMQALEDAGATETQIKGSIRDYFKPLYQQAYMRGDAETMEDIEDKVIDATSGFAKKNKITMTTIEGWVPGAEDEEDEDEEELQRGYQWLNLTNR